MRDITPTWKGILPLLLAAYKDGTDKGREIAKLELQRMAEAADLWNEHADDIKVPLGSQVTLSAAGGSGGKEQPK
jgi:hypothetical protein